MTRVEGYLDIDAMLKEIGIEDTSSFGLGDSPLIENYRLEFSNLFFSFVYHGNTYFYKHAKVNGATLDPYGELVAEELARDFGIPCAEYDLAVLGNRYGVLSKDFRKPGARYILGEEIFSNFLNYYYSGLEEDSSKVSQIPENVLDDIWDELEIRYHGNRQIVSHLMKCIVDIYLFDIISCQIDRHERNWQIMESSDGVDIAPLYDSGRILLDTGEEAEVCLGIEIEVGAEKLFDSIQKFLKVSSEEFSSIIMDKLWIIGDENLHSIFDRIEKKTGYPMPYTKKKFYFMSYFDHKRSLEEILERILEKEKQDEGKNR